MLISKKKKKIRLFTWARLATEQEEEEPSEGRTSKSFEWQEAPPTGLGNGQARWPELQDERRCETRQVQQGVKKLHCSPRCHQRGQQIHKVVHQGRAVPRQQLQMYLVLFDHIYPLVVWVLFFLFF